MLRHTYDRCISIITIHMYHIFLHSSSVLSLTRIFLLLLLPCTIYFLTCIASPVTTEVLPHLGTLAAAWLEMLVLFEMPTGFTLFKVLNEGKLDKVEVSARRHLSSWFGFNYSRFFRLQNNFSFRGWSRTVGRRYTRGWSRTTIVSDPT